MPHTILLLNCPDRRGIVAAVANFLVSQNANIISADQHQDRASERFLMRVVWESDEPLNEAVFRASFEPIALAFHMTWRIADASQRSRIAIFVSGSDHCLADLLYRHQNGELVCDIPLIISNHEKSRQFADFYQIPFHYMPINAQTKLEVESRQRELLQQHNIDLVILARYMQILSGEFVAQYRQRIINVHHSFLPAFSGARPYQRAFEHGVKIIGATSHYVTEGLDEGPIIEQDVIRISHRDQLSDLIEKGRDLERTVLSRAVRWHLEQRILLYNEKTVIFS